MTMARIVAATMLVAGSGVALHVTLAQQPPGITRTQVVRHDLDVPGREVIQVRVDFAPDAAFGEHSHPAQKSPMSSKALWSIDSRGIRR